jgi:hypothetical protein
VVKGTGLTVGEFCVRQNVGGKLKEEATLKVTQGEVTTLEMM